MLQAQMTWEGATRRKSERGSVAASSNRDRKALGKKRSDNDTSSSVMTT